MAANKPGRIRQMAAQMENVFVPATPEALNQNILRRHRHAQTPESSENAVRLSLEELAEGHSQINPVRWANVIDISDFRESRQSLEYGDFREKQEVKFELLLTELTYLIGLRKFTCSYINKLRGFLSEADHNALFHDILAITAFTEGLVKAYESVWEKDARMSGIYKAFNGRSARYLIVYKNYTRKIELVRERLKLLKENNEEFKKILPRLEQHAGGVRIEEAFNAPVQRITRMKLLFENILKNLYKGCVEYNECAEALETIKEILGLCNDAIDEPKNLKTLLALNNKLYFPPDVSFESFVTPKRTMLLDTMVINYELRGFSEVDTERLRLILFSDFFIVCSCTKFEKYDYTVVDKCKYDDLKMEELDFLPLYKNQIKLCEKLIPVAATLQRNKRGQRVRLMLAFDSAADRRKWLAKLHPSEIS